MTQACYATSDRFLGLADIISPTKSPRPPSEPIESATPDTPLDSSNPFLFPTGDDLPNDTKPAQQASTDQKVKPRTNSPVARPANPSGALAKFEELRAARRPNTALARNALTLQERAANQVQASRRNAIEAQMSRIWREGDVYSPHDLSPAEQMKAKSARTPARARDMRPVNTRRNGSRDVIDDLGINPLKEYKNFKMMSEFVTEMGRIRHSRDTGFRMVNQRRIARAVRRAHGLGLLPTVHRHPELLEERANLRKSDTEIYRRGY